MLGFNHVLAGSIIAVIVPAPFVPLVALVSHYILDLSPHYGGDPKVQPFTKRFKGLLAIDGTLCVAGFAYAVWLFPNHWILICIGSAFATLPDFFRLFLYRRISRSFDKFLEWGEWIQWGERPYGWLFDAFYALMMVITLCLLAH